VTFDIPIWQKFDWDAYFDMIPSLIPEYGIPILDGFLHWFTSPPGWIKNTPSSVLELITVLMRMFMFFVFGVSRLEAVVNRVRHERILKSFDFVPMSEVTAKAPNRLFAEPLYQYRPLWLVLIPLFMPGTLSLLRSLKVYTRR
jgi:hypothetical protein